MKKANRFKDWETEKCFWIWGTFICLTAVLWFCFITLFCQSGIWEWNSEKDTVPVSWILKYFQSGSLSPMDMKQQNELRNVFICYSNKFSFLFLSCCSSCALSFNPSLPFQRNAGRCWVWIPFWLSRRKADVMLSLFKPSLNLKNFSACLLISNLKLWHNFIQKMQLDPCRNDCMPSWLRLAFASGIA